MPAAILSLLAAVALPVRADSLTIRGKDGGGGLSYNVSIDHIGEGQIFYRLNSELKSRSLGDVAAFKLDDEPDFDDASDAYNQQNWATATADFSKAMAGTDKEWLKDWIAPRLLESANHAGRFDAAVAAWIRLLAIDAGSNADKQPPVTTNAGQLDAAAKALTGAAKTDVGAAQRAVLALLLQVETARQDAAAAGAVARQLEQIGMTSSAESGAIAAVEQQTRIALAQTALGQKNYNQAIGLIDASASLLSDPARQSDALFIRAQALEGKAASAPNGADAWKDAALAYMRVYVHFRDGVGSQHSAAALMKTAGIEETHLGDPGAALALYQKVASEYKDSSEALQAATEISRLAGSSAGH